MSIVRTDVGEIYPGQVRRIPPKPAYQELDYSQNSAVRDYALWPWMIIRTIYCVRPKPETKLCFGEVVLKAIASSGPASDLSASSNGWEYW
jgi:hypothetical protein